MKLLPQSEASAPRNEGPDVTSSSPVSILELASRPVKPVLLMRRVTAINLTKRQAHPFT